MQESESNFLHHAPCPHCGSSDANSVYDDGHQFCFSCQTYTPADGEAPTPQTKRNKDLISGDFMALGKRAIREETCRKFGYQVGRLNDKPVQIAPYYDREGNLVAQKIRTPDKDFKVLGDLKDALPFGANLWGKGKKLVVTEGEIDALSVSQAQGNKWPVVSIPNGAQGAKKHMQKCFDYYDSFEEVIVMFDQDEPGRKAAQEVCQLFAPGKAKVAALSMKDANELLVAGKEQEIIQAIWNAKPYRPDGIISGEDLWEAVSKVDLVQSVPYPWAALNAVTRGARRGELVTLTAGSGIGKSAIVREIAYHLLQQGETVGMIMLEENTKRTALGLMGLHLNKPLHLDREGVSESDLRNSFNATVGCGRLYLYDHWGSSDIENLISRVRFLARGCGCGWIILDHLSIVVSGLGDGDERRLIDNAMTYLRTLVEETGVGLFLVSHLKRPEGNKGHEQGAQTALAQLRGSHSIAQLSDLVIGLERDQQGKSPNVTTLRVLKNRFSGETGIAGYVHYDRETGRLSETDEPGQFEDETNFEKEF
jgi:twinkle protein